MFKLILFCLFLVLITYFEHCAGHGMMLDPPNRSSRWRFDETAPFNYDDNALWCGGLTRQFRMYGGKCGLCGDDYSQPRPRANELGGKYGQGVITKNYTHASTITVGAKITMNHLGYVVYDLCNLDEFGAESEECFQKYKLKHAHGQDKYQVGSKTGMVYTRLVLPKGLTCKHCVLRWTYTAGNTWGTCDDGTQAMGCGPQEHFRNCADISIKKI